MPDDNREFEYRARREKSIKWAAFLFAQGVASIDIHNITLQDWHKMHGAAQANPPGSLESIEMIASRVLVLEVAAEQERRRAAKSRLMERLARLVASEDHEMAHLDADEALLEFIGDPEVTEAFRKVRKHSGDANASRIAAAPDLYGALEIMLCPNCLNRIGWSGAKGDMELDWRNCNSCRSARAALARARGEHV